MAISAPDRWFTYYYWEDDAKAPPWACEVDIHSKPGYDPLELFMDPKVPLKIPRVMARLGMRALGFNAGKIMNFIPFDSEAPKMIKGSHGRLPDSPAAGPVFLSSSRKHSLPEHLKATEVKAALLKMMLG